VPRGLLGRSLLIILVPLLLLQAIALQVFYGSHLDVISRRLAAGVAGDIAMVVGLLDRETEAKDRSWIFREAAWRLDLSLAYEAGAMLALSGARPAAMPWLPLEEDLAAAMLERVRLPFDADWQSDPRSVIIRVQMPDGILHVEVARKRLFSGTIYLFVIWLVGSSLLLFLVAAIFMRNQVRALRKISAAAEAFGMGRTVGPMKPEGAAEVRQAATAFNRMEERISRFVDSRTEMLAGISHDLRTPLTRLRLGLPFADRLTLHRNRFVINFFGDGGGGLGELAEDGLELETVDFAGAVEVEHVEGLLQLLLREHVRFVDGADRPLGVVNGAAPVHVNFVPDVVHL
jgi:two-component system osmolarity sensor histidine kinase EnvZ